MSKFLKFIVNVIVVCIILVAGALVIPRLAGVDTYLIDAVGMETNLPLGSATYAKEVNKSDLKTGDKLIIDTDGKIFEYQVKDMDATADSYTVKDALNANGEEQTISLGETVIKPVITVPFIAYGAMAMQSMEGLIIIGLGVVFLIILFVLAELWKKDRDDEYEEDEDEDDEEDADEEDGEQDEPKSRRQLKLEEKARRKEEKRRRKMGIDEEESEEEPVTLEAAATAVHSETIHEPISHEAEMVLQETMSSIAADIHAVHESPELEAAPSEADTAETAVLPKVSREDRKETVVAALTGGIAVEDIVIQEPKLPSEKIPSSISAAQLLEKAEKQGEMPDIKKDDEVGITLLDYSDLL